MHVPGLMHVPHLPSLSPLNEGPWPQCVCPHLVQTLRLLWSTRLLHNIPESKGKNDLIASFVNHLVSLGPIFLPALALGGEMCVQFSLMNKPCLCSATLVSP